MAEQQHIVKKMVIELLVGKQQEAIYLQDAIISATEQEFMGIVDKVFSEFSSAGGMIEIDTLEIDLGAIQKENLVRELSEKLAEKLLDELAKRGGAREQMQENSEGVIVVKSELEIFVYFLRQGRLPWWNKKVQSISNLFEVLLEHKRKVFVALMAEELKKERSLLRFIKQFTTTQITVFLASSVPYRHQAIKKFLEESIEPHVKQLPFSKQQQAHSILWRNVIDYFVLTNFSEFLDEDLDRIIEETIVEYSLQVNFTNGEIQKKKQAGEEKKQKKSLNKKNKHHIGSDSEGDVAKTEQGQKVNRNLFNKEKKIVLEKAVQKREENTLEEGYEEILQFDEEIYIENAGLVLFWPYLTTFFRTLGLLEKNDFKDEFSRNKALYLLAYLSSGLNTSEEHQLFLAKILCGWELTLAPNKLVLSDEETEEAENLTRAVIDHWKMLRNTSSEGLRETFIRRDGILIFKEGSGWQLRVERKGVDVLMGALPWGISVVRLTWMPHTLHVEW